MGSIHLNNVLGSAVSNGDETTPLDINHLGMNGRLEGMPLLSSGTSKQAKKTKCDIDCK